MKNILVIIPAYNESENIAKVLIELEKDFPESDVLVINDCSIDDTLKILEELGTNYISTPFNMGYSGALQLGFKYAVKHNYEYVLQFDGDGQHIASEAVKMFNKAQKGKFDIVIGSRFINNYGYKHSLMRKIGTYLFVSSIKFFCKQEISDPTSGFQLLNRRVFTRYSNMGEYPDYPDANLIIQMLSEGYKITEIPVVMRERIYGTSMHSGIIKPVKYMIKMFYSILIILLIKVIHKKR